MKQSSPRVSCTKKERYANPGTADDFLKKELVDALARGEDSSQARYDATILAMERYGNYRIEMYRGEYKRSLISFIEEGVLPRSLPKKP